MPTAPTWKYRQEHDILYKRDDHGLRERVDHFGWGIKNPPRSPLRPYQLPTSVPHFGTVGPYGHALLGRPPTAPAPAPCPAPSRARILPLGQSSGPARHQWSPEEFEELILEKIRGKTKGANGQALRGIRLFTNATEGVRPPITPARTHPNGEVVRLRHVPQYSPPVSPRDVIVTPRRFKQSLERLIGCPVTSDEAKLLFEKWDTDGGGTLEPSEIVCETLMPVPYSIMKIPPAGFVPGGTLFRDQQHIPYQRRFGMSEVKHKRGVRTSMH